MSVWNGMRSASPALLECISVLACCPTARGRRQASGRECEVFLRHRTAAVPVCQLSGRRRAPCAYARSGDKTASRGRGADQNVRLDLALPTTTTTTVTTTDALQLMPCFCVH